MANLFIVQSDGKVTGGLKCTGCDLAYNCRLKTNCMQGSGTLNPDFLVVGHQPGVEDDGIGKPFTGGNGRLFQSLLNASGLTQDRLYLSNLLKCSLFGEKPKPAYWKACQKHFIEELKRVKPKAIITLGAQALSWLTGMTGVRQFRRCGIPCLFDPSIYVYPLQQPIAIEHAESSQEADTIRTEMVSDLVWLKDKANEGTLDRPDDVKTDYQLAETVEDVERFLSEFPVGSTVCFDLETADKDMNPTTKPTKDSRIVIFAFSNGTGHARVIPFRARGVSTMEWWTEEQLAKVKALLDKFLREHAFYGHNAAKFDAKWIYVHFGILLNISYDTMLHHYLLDENLNHGLEDVTVQYTKMTPWKPPSLQELMKDTLGLGKYACRDVDGTSRIRAAMKYEPRVTWLMENLMIPLSREFMYMELDGIAIVPENLERYGKYLDELIAEHLSALRAMKVVQKFELAENVAFNYEAPTQVAKIMEHYLQLPRIKSTKLGNQYSTDNSVLEQHLSDEFVSHIYFLRKLTKLKSSYYEVIKEAMGDGTTVHTSVQIHRTVTGRAASKDPNLFTPPREDTVSKTGIKDPKIAKAIFGPHLDRGQDVLLQVDMSQIELRVLGMYSKDPALLTAYREGLDLHTATAAKAFNVPMDQVAKWQRTGAKRVNFGLVYGMGENSLCEKFVSAMRESYLKEGKPFTEEVQAQATRNALAFLDMHKEIYPGIWSWMAKQERLIRQHGYQETFFGRRRHYYKVGPREIRQSLNFPIQSTATDLCYFAMLWANKLIREEGLNATFVLTVYDSLIYSVATAEAKRVARIVKSCMEEMLPAMFDFVNLPVIADIEIGKDLGHMESLVLDENNMRS